MVHGFVTTKGMHMLGKIDSGLFSWVVPYIYVILYALYKIRISVFKLVKLCSSTMVCLFNLYMHASSLSPDLVAFVGSVSFTQSWD